MIINMQNLIDETFLAEKRTRDVIVCDIQPMYKQWWDFDLNDFSEFLLRNERILFFYNGPDTVGDDTKEDIVDMFYEATESEEIVDKLNSSDTIWIDKGYSFFRSWMDMSADEGFIQNAIRYMVMKRKNDSRDIDPEEWKEQFPYDFDEDTMVDDPIQIPDIQIGQLKTWSGSYLTGGGRYECLREVQLLMNAFNIKYTLVDDFVFGE